jgi:hypothetical protein
VSPPKPKCEKIFPDRRLAVAALDWRLMRTVVAWLLATVSVLGSVAPIAAAPPDDVAAYCRATYPQVQFQVRCLNVENAAIDRVRRAAPAADRETFNRCLTSGSSWAAVDSCLAQSAAAGPTAGEQPAAPGGAPSGPLPALNPAAPRAGAAGPPPPSPAAPSPEPTQDTPFPASGSTIVLGPQGQPALAAAPERDRPARQISEADAERHLRGILERVGAKTARCTKKQYGPGWVSICE